MNFPLINNLFNIDSSSSNETANRVEEMANIQKEGLELFRKKNQDYGDAFANYGAIGVLVRMGDKISRLQSITNNSISLINSESLRDTLIDLHNYSAMAIMLLDEDKKKHKDTCLVPPKLRRSHMTAAPPPSPLTQNND